LLSTLSDATFLDATLNEESTLSTFPPPKTLDWMKNWRSILSART
jgi:hypothetical protein